MSITLAAGTQVAIASTYGAAVAASAASNASACVLALATGHGVSVGDFLEYTCDWDLATDRVFRASVVSGDNVTLEGLNTTSTLNYPAGDGVGSIRRITAWTNIKQIKGFAKSGGEQQFTDITDVSDRTQKRMPTTASPVDITLTMFEDLTLAGYTAIAAAAAASTPAALRMVLSNGSRLVINGYWSLQKTPNIASGEPLTVDATVSAVSEPTRYAT